MIIFFFLDLYRGQPAEQFLQARWSQRGCQGKKGAIVRPTSYAGYIVYGLISCEACECDSLRPDFRL